MVNKNQLDPQSIVFEYPFDWNKDKNSLHKIFLDNFIHVITLANKPVSIINALWPSYGIKRIPVHNTITIAFHSFNNPDNVWSFKEAPIHGLYSIDKNGYSGWSEIHQNQEKYIKIAHKLSSSTTKHILETYRTQIQQGITKYKQPSAAKNLPANFIFFPLQVQTDSVAKLAYLDAIDVLERLNELSKKYQQYIVIKRHPWCQSNAIPLKLQLLKQENPYLIESNTEITDLIQKSDAVIACNSGVSLEALICNKPVFCFGSSEWEYASHVIKSIDDIESVFNIRAAMNTSQQKFIAYLLSHYWIKYNDIDALKKRFELICHQFVPEIGKQVNNIREAQKFLDEYLLQYQQKYTTKQNEIFKIEKEYKHLVASEKALKNNPLFVLAYFFKNILRK